MTIVAHLCPHCGKQIPAVQEADPPQRDDAKAANADREYDHRGILLPQRTRMGGIIIPQ